MNLTPEEIERGLKLAEELMPSGFKLLETHAVALFTTNDSRMETIRPDDWIDISDLLPRALRDLKELREADQWLPIKTAPKDGSEILLGSLPQKYNGEPVPARSTVGHWMEDEYGDSFWMSWDGGFTDVNPATHWRPLPPPPITQGGE